MPVVKNGVIDLRNWDFIKNGNINLDGDWEFYWNEILSYDELKKRNQPKHFIHVPMKWNDYKYNNKKIKAYGYATYKVKILLKEGEKNLALKINQMSTASTTYIDDKILDKQGVVGTDESSSIPDYKPGVLTFRIQKNQIDLILQISNYDYANGGLWERIILGNAKNIEKSYNSKLFLEFFLFGSILIMAFYHLFMYLIRKKYKATLYFSIFCFLISLRIFLTGEKFLYTSTDINWLLLLKCEFLTFYFGLVIFVLFICHLFPEDTHKTVNKIYFTVASIFCTIVIVTPSSFFTNTLPYYQIISIIIGLYIFYVIAKALTDKKDGAMFLLIGYIFVFATSIHDILYYQQIVKTTDLIPIGLFFFIFSQAASISLQFSKAFQDVEKLSGELTLKISDLEKANKKITLSEEKYRVLVEGTKDIIFTLDDKWNFISANNSIQKDLNIHPDQITSINFLDLIYEGDDANTGSKEIVRGKLEQLTAEKNEIYFKTNFKSSISSEPMEMAVALEYIKTEGNYEIIGKMFRVIEDQLLKYLIAESQKFQIENYIIISADISQRLTRNIEKYISKDQIKYIQLALREMIINAIEHGNLNISYDEKSKVLFNGDYMNFISKRQHDPKYRDKRVTISYSIKEDELIYVIEDEGEGFNHQKFTSGDIMEKSDKIESHGRGIAMTMKIFDTIKYNEKGNQVTLIKKIQDRAR